ncbi:MAG TPA: isopentenyl phosphate kinase [Thermoanaerobaculia bacterium]|nr:isopentenyl phosphate kinase [Thermoanaerobaculia bacterium]
MPEATEAILVKLGGSLITDKARAETARLPVIQRLAGEIARAASRTPARLIVGHGSGSFGHVAAARHHLAAGLSGQHPDQRPGISLTQERAAALHWQVMAALLAAGALPFSLAPSSALVAAGGTPAAFFEEPLLLALERGLLPVLYGDVVMDRTQGVAICSTERLLTLLARRLPERGIAVRHALWLGETAGVWDGEGKTIPHLTRADLAGLGEALGGSAGTAGADVTGGMRHRVETALDLADLGIVSQILDGREPGLLERAVAGEAVPGTRIG